MKKIMMIILVLVLMLTSCGQERMTLSGRIVEVNTDSHAVLIEEQNLNGLVWVGFEKKFKFKSGVSKDLYVGNVVMIQVDGAIMESYPMQALGYMIIENE
jgi:hypothetical protein